MQNPINWQALAINRLISDTKKLTETYVECFNCTTDDQLRELLNNLSPNISAAELMLKDYALRNGLTPGK